MSTTIQSNLFEPAADPPIAASVGWIEGVVLGQVAVSLCVLAVAFVGYGMLTGRLALRRGALVLLGCFILFGAPLIAAALMEMSVEQRAAPPPPEVDHRDPRDGLEQRHSDPYSGA